MAQIWTEDNTIAGKLAGLAQDFSGKTQMDLYNTAEDVKKKRAEAAAAAAATQANRDMWMARQPPTVAPVTPNQEAWVNSSGARGTETVPLDGLTPLRALTPDIASADAAATVQAQQQRNAEFERVRAKQLADAAVGYQHVTSMGDIATNAPKLEANTQLDLYGVPKTLDDQLKMQTQLTGQLPMLDVKGTTNNYIVRDPQGNVTTTGVTRDGRTDLTTGQPIVVPPGHSVGKMSDISSDQGPYKDKGSELTALEQLNNKATIGQPFNLTDMQRSAILLNSQFPLAQKIEKDDAGNIRAITYNEKAVPAVFAPLIAKLNEAAGVRPAPTGAPATPATQSPPAPAPGVTTGPMPATPAPAPADTKPIVPAGAIAAPAEAGASNILVQGSGDTQLKESDR
jgi:hypothetical protein